MTRRNKKTERPIYRSAKTGRMVTKRYAETHPSTTLRERRPAPRQRSPQRSRLRFPCCCEGVEHARDPAPSSLKHGEQA